jgi:phenylalanyl-tRNA synthetase beta subunit
MQTIGVVELENPLASDKKFMRHTLAHGLAKSLELNTYNAPLFGLGDIKIFEIGKVFEKDREYLSLGIAIGAVKNKIIEELQKVKDELVKILGVAIDTVSVEDRILLIDFDDLISKLPEPTSYVAYTQPAEVRYKSPSTYPFMLRDIALFIPENIESGEVVKIITENAGELLQRLDLFDVFNKEGRVSYAFRLVFQSSEKTLSDDEVNKVMEKVTTALSGEDGWSVR